MHLLILACASAPMSTAPVSLTIMESQSYFNTNHAVDMNIGILTLQPHCMEPGSAGTLHAWNLALQAHCMAEPGSAGTLHAWNLTLQPHCMEPGSAGTLHAWNLALQAHCMAEPGSAGTLHAWNLALQAHCMHGT